MQWILLGMLVLLPVFAPAQTPAKSKIPYQEAAFDLAPDAWTQSPDDFMAANRSSGLRWESAAKDSARVSHPGLSFLGMPVYEIIARFDHDTLKEISASVYNRGDAGDLSEDEFAKMMQGVDAKLNLWADSKGILLRTQERSVSATLHRKSWVKEPHRIDLVWSYTEARRVNGQSLPPRPEFARLQVTRFDPAQDPRKSILATDSSTAPKTITAFELKQRVKHDPNGDNLIPSVPMVDQGEKGYCAVAVAERVLRYYGRNVDQHEIAQLANTSSGSGTSFEQMLVALRRIGDQTRMDVAVLQECGARDIEKTVADYNRATKRRDSHILYENPLMAYQDMDVNVLREVRVKRDGAMEEFKKKLTAYINNGVPLTWGCVVGKVPEKPAIHGFGGHMRLIIGYNDRTNEILYTDTWGSGHELKRMPFPDAWTVTLGLYCFQPRDIHF